MDLSDCQTRLSDEVTSHLEAAGDELLNEGRALSSLLTVRRHVVDRLLAFLHSAIVPLPLSNNQTNHSKSIDTPF